MKKRPLHIIANTADGVAKYYSDIDRGGIVHEKKREASNDVTIER